MQIDVSQQFRNRCPCGEPCTLSVTTPASSLPAFSHLRINQSWLTVPKKPRISTSTIQLTFLPLNAHYQRITRIMLMAIWLCMTRQAAAWVFEGDSLVAPSARCTQLKCCLPTPSASGTKRRLWRSVSRPKRKRCTNSGWALVGRASQQSFDSLRAVPLPSFPSGRGRFRVRRQELFPCLATQQLSDAAFRYRFARDNDALRNLVFRQTLRHVRDDIRL